MGGSPVGAIGPLFGGLVGLGIAAAAVDIMRSTLAKQKGKIEREHRARNMINPYTQYRGMQGVKPTLQRQLPGVYREFPGAGKAYSINVQERLKRML